MRKDCDHVVACNSDHGLVNACDANKLIVHHKQMNSFGDCTKREILERGPDLETFNFCPWCGEKIDWENL